MGTSKRVGGGKKSKSLSSMKKKPTVNKSAKLRAERWGKEQAKRKAEGRFFHEKRDPGAVPIKKEKKKSISHVWQARPDGSIHRLGLLLRQRGELPASEDGVVLVEVTDFELQKQFKGKGIRNDWVVEKVQGEPVMQDSYDTVLGMIKSAGRPLKITFCAPEFAPEIDDS